ncbi:MAG: hypothetical protein K5860_03705 [Bacteroidales bacterium]|nr:hypothetical protein [Bacteroidales bacterium]
MKNRLLILLLLSFGISCAYSQPIYPGSLTVLFTNENDTLVIESCNDKNNEYKTSSLQYYFTIYKGYSSRDTCLIYIKRSSIKLGNNESVVPRLKEHLVGPYCRIETGTSLCEGYCYSIKEISIFKNGTERMKITLENGENTWDYFIHIPFLQGEYKLDIEKLQQEHYEQALTEVERKYEKLPDRETELKNVLFFNFDKSFLSSDEISPFLNRSKWIVTPFNWENLKNDLPQDD